MTAPTNPPSQRSAIVTGGSSGIGLAIAHALGADGYAITLVARRAEKLARAAEELAAAGVEVDPLAISLSDADAVRAMVSQHENRHRSLDVLINNAGVAIASPTEQLEDKLVDLQLNVNLLATLWAYREAVPLLRAAVAARGSALVVNTASIYGLRASAEMAVYSAAKGAIVRLTEAMNREFGGEGIRSTALCPGAVDTPMMDFARTPVSSPMIPPEDIAGFVSWLAASSPQVVVPEIAIVRHNDPY